MRTYQPQRSPGSELQSAAKAGVAEVRRPRSHSRIGRRAARPRPRPPRSAALPALRPRADRVAWRVGDPSTLLNPPVIALDVTSPNPHFHRTRSVGLSVRRPPTRPWWTEVRAQCSSQHAYAHYSQRNESCQRRELLMDSTRTTRYDAYKDHEHSAFARMSVLRVERRALKARAVTAARPVIRTRRADR